MYIDPISCKEYANKYLSDLPEDQLLSLYAEMNDGKFSPESFLCPDVDSFQISGQNQKSGISFGVRVYMTEAFQSSYSTATQSEKTKIESTIL